MDIILEQIELKENKLNDNTFDIFYNYNTKKFHAFENDVENGELREFVYELTDTEDNIANNHREEILEYCLAVVTKNDSVGLGDIFVHGKYVTHIA
jgi:hypothetical protein